MKLMSVESGVRHARPGGLCPPGLGCRPPNLTAIGINFSRQRRGTASVEFALNGLAIMLFIFAIINLADLGLVVGTMKHGVQAAARNAAVETGVLMAQTDNSGDCVSQAQVIALFNQVATPILPAAAGSSNNGAPVVQTAWSNAANGASLTVTASYRWMPVGMPNEFGNGIPLTITSTQTVIGTSGAATTCS